MGKDLNGKDLGKGITQRKDGLYMARAVVNKKKIPTIYGSNLKELRKKLESAPGAPQYIHTVRGVGYKLVVPKE